MEPGALSPDELATPERDQPPVRFIPTPSAAYQQQHRLAQLLEQPAEPSPLPESRAEPPSAALPDYHPDDDQPAEAPPLPHAFGARVLMWKQDPSVGDMGTRRAYLPGPVLAGPRDARIAPGSPGIDPVEPNAFGDFVTQPDTPQFDAVHTFAVVRQTLTMYQRALLAAGLDMPLPWQWNTSMDTRPLAIYPYGLPNVMNAFYSRSQGCLKFGDFIPIGKEAGANAGAQVDESARVYTCRSFDIVAHETAHAVLDGLKPQWLLADAPPQTGGLHEAFGDLTAIFLALSQLDQCEAVVAQTKAHLHDKTFLADIAEQFGMALGGATGLRNADNDLTLGQAGTQVHAISQVFTGAMYDVLADMFAYERDPQRDDCAAVLHRVAAYLRGLLLRALIAAPDSAATYVDVVNEMLRIVAEDGQPGAYAGFIRNQFARRDVVELPPGAAAQPEATTTSLSASLLCEPLAAKVCDAPGARQDRRHCCGTMHLPEYHKVDKVLDSETQALARWCAANGRIGECVVPVAAAAAAGAAVGAAVNAADAPAAT